MLRRLSNEFDTAKNTIKKQIVLNETTVVKARALHGEEWSALNEATFNRRSPFEALCVTEIMYHPPGAVDTADDRYEFIELRNGGNVPLDLTNAAFTRGIYFAFPAGTILNEGEYLVLASDGAAFAERYPGVSAAGVYAGQLDNDGDHVILRAPDGGILHSFTYGDAGWWPRGADGEGHSLVPRNGTGFGDLDDPAFWRDSTVLFGSPGAADGEVEPPTFFLRGDTNTDSRLTVSDAIVTLRVLFAGAPAGTCDDAHDVNDDGIVNIADPLALLSYLFSGGMAPPAPLQACGPDPTPDGLECDSFEPCR